jgi:hypothetical protein
VVGREGKGGGSGKGEGGERGERALFDGDGCAKVLALVDRAEAALADLLAKIEVLVVDVPRLIEVADQSFVRHLLLCFRVCEFSLVVAKDRCGAMGQRNEPPHHRITSQLSF